MRTLKISLPTPANGSSNQFAHDGRIAPLIAIGNYQSRAPTAYFRAVLPGEGFFYPRNEGGSGLGLVIVKHLVQAHDGNVWTESLRAVSSDGCLIPNCHF